MTRHLTAAVLLLGLLVLPACKPREAAPAKSPPPAKVAQPANEKDLATITLTPQAEQRLGIRTVAVERNTLPRQRILSGEVLVPPGQSVLVAAPVSGTLAAPKGREVPLPGAAVAQDQPIFTLIPLLTPERSVLTPAERVRMAESRAALATSQIDAEKDIQTAKVKLEAAEIARRRADQLLRDGVGTRQALEEADAQLSVARKSLEAAEARYALVKDIQLDTPEGSAQPRTITAPVGGTLSKVSAVPGATVVAGTALFEVFQPDRVWIRVPVYVGLWRDVDTGKDAVITEFGQAPQPGGRKAAPVAAPPSANALAATLDLFYELPNDRGDLRPGHKVAVTLTMQSRGQSLTVPWAAVLHDIHGGTWVYEQVAPQTFVRRRVHVRFVSDGSAVLAVGPKPGTQVVADAQVVTDGAAELYGTEFGFGK